MKIAEKGSLYESAAEELRRRFAADGCILIVLAGSEGTGIGWKMPEELEPHLPAFFHSVAHEVKHALAGTTRMMTCPACLSALAFDPRHGPSPTHLLKAGAIALCAECASALTLDEVIGWRVLRGDEYEALEESLRASISRTRRNIARRRRRDA